MKPSIHLRNLALALALLCSGAPTSAEVSVHVVDDTCSRALVTIRLGIIIEDADPVGHSAWRPMGSGRRAVVVNPSGAARGDLMPDLVFDSEACVVRLVWSYKTGSDDFDVAYARIDGETESFEFLTSETTDDRDPRMFVADDGTELVVWWSEDGEQTVHLRTRAPGEAWTFPLSLSTPEESARYPSVVSDGRAIRVAYERRIDGGRAQIVVATVAHNGSISREVVGETDLAGRTDPVIHSVGGRVWLEWKQTADSLAYIELRSRRWSAPVTVPRKDGSWLDDEAARRAVRRLLFAP